MAARGGYKGGTGKAAFQNAPGVHIAAFFVPWIKSPLASVKCRYGANNAPTRADMRRRLSSLFPEYHLERARRPVKPSYLLTQ